MALQAPFSYILAGWFRPSTYTGEPAMYAAGAFTQYGYSRAWWNNPGGFTYYRYFHPGVDLRAAYGTPIVAGEAGVVTKAGWSSSSSGYAVNVQIRPGVKYVHGHCSRVAVSVGQRVARGQIIAYVGQSGDASVPHSHHGVEAFGMLYNPMLFYPGGAMADVWWIRPESSGGVQYCTMKAGSNVRATPSGSGTLIGKLYYNNRTQYKGTVTGGAYSWWNGSAWVTRSDWAKVVYAGVDRYLVRVNVIL
jgi:hypothetical protein